MVFMKQSVQVKVGSQSCGFLGTRKCDTYDIRYVEQPVYHITTQLIPNHNICEDRMLVCCNHFLMVAQTCMHETGLYYMALPDDILTHKDNDVAGSKKLKDRITTLVACNMTVTDKRKLLVIGKSKDPRCFRGKKSLPVIYKINKNAWITAEIFIEWLREMNKDMCHQNRKRLMLVDNCSAHPKDAADRLEHVDLEFLPPNTTATEYMDFDNNTECYGELTDTDIAASILQDKPMRNSDPTDDTDSKDELEESIITVNFSQVNTSHWFTACYGGKQLY
ncbi:unnamed protein product [Mytilus coruscus]|uniref:DDE-1 domain-containing protein n=1 Tax=Mytilus coruscus TaxID=42192 RepID=A0A6J8ERV4_MYTCO|nr:unnamed protein product [Mytilus coruscus]